LQADRARDLRQDKLRHFALDVLGQPQSRAPRQQFLYSCLSLLKRHGAIIFKHACKMGLEGIVSKRRDLPYRSGRVRSWIKVKNLASPAMLRIIEEGAW
jgi:ATP-dependent DNA ligase